MDQIKSNQQTINFVTDSQTMFNSRSVNSKTNDPEYLISTQWHFTSDMQLIALCAWATETMLKTIKYIRIAICIQRTKRNWDQLWWHNQRNKNMQKLVLKKVILRLGLLSVFQYHMKEIDIFNNNHKLTSYRDKKWQIILSCYYCLRKRLIKSEQSNYVIDEWAPELILMKPSSLSWTKIRTKMQSAALALFSLPF